MTLRAADDRGSGSVLALGILCAVLTVTAGAVTVVGAAAAHARAAVGADLAALAAADVAGGRAPGAVCDTAREVAAVNGADLTGCAHGGAIVTVEASVPYLGFRAVASARAGPPDSG